MHQGRREAGVLNRMANPHAARPAAKLGTMMRERGSVPETSDCSERSIILSGISRLPAMMHIWVNTDVRREIPLPV
jgi:hypothetical protein